MICMNQLRDNVKCFSRIPKSIYHIDVGLSHPKFLSTLGLTTPSYPNFYPLRII